MPEDPREGENVGSSFWYCRACGQENFGESQFCEDCGRARSEVATSTPPPERRNWKEALLDRLRGRGAGGGSGETPPPEEAVDAGPVAAEAGSPPGTPTGTEKLPSERPPRRPPPRSPFQRGGEAEPAAGGAARRKVRMRFLHLSERLKGAFTRDNYREVLADRSNPATTMLIAFVAWAIFRLVGFAPLMMLLRFLAFLMGPFGLVLTLAVAYVYSRHREEIDQRVATLRRRARAFGMVTGEVARSMGWVRRQLDRLRGSREGEEESRGTRQGPGSGTPVKGASVRILEEPWEDEEDAPGSPS